MVRRSACSLRSSVTIGAATVQIRYWLEHAGAPVDATAGRIARHGHAVVELQRLFNHVIPPVGVFKPVRSRRGRQQLCADLRPQSDWTGGILCATPSAAPRIQPVTPPIFITSSIMKSEALASMAFCMSPIPHQFSPALDRCDAGGSLIRGVTTVIVRQRRLFDPGDTFLIDDAHAIDGISWGQ